MNTCDLRVIHPTNSRAIHGFCATHKAVRPLDAATHEVTPCTPMRDTVTADVDPGYTGSLYARLGEFTY